MRALSKRRIEKYIKNEMRLYGKIQNDFYLFLWRDMKTQNTIINWFKNNN